METYTDDYLMHYGVLGMKWGHRKSQYYEAKASRQTAKAEKLRAKAAVKRQTGTNSVSARMSYAKKEQKAAAAEKFHNQKALGLGRISKLTGSTLSYTYNKTRAAQDAIRKEKYSVAKTGVTNKVNRLEYRAAKADAKAADATLKKKVNDLAISGASASKINSVVSKSLGTSISSTTFQTTTSYRDRKQVSGGGYANAVSPLRNKNATSKSSTESTKKKQ